MPTTTWTFVLFQPAHNLGDLLQLEEVEHVALDRKIGEYRAIVGSLGCEAVETRYYTVAGTISAT